VPGEAGSFGGQNLAIREDPERGFYVAGANEFSVRSFEEAVELLNWGLAHRAMGATAMNDTSSRSHTLLSVRVHRRIAVGADGGLSGETKDRTGVHGHEPMVDSRAMHGTLMMVDLAGSESVRRTTSQGTRLKEA